MDEQLTTLERAVRKADGAALGELVARLERLHPPSEVDVRVTAFTPARSSGAAARPRAS